MTIHSVTLVFLKSEVLLQTLLGTRPLTQVNRERTVAHTCQYDTTLHYTIYVLHSTLTSHNNGMT